jgi:thiamine biosynthesis lipoprotein
MSSRQARFRAMGTDCHVIVDARADVVDDLLDLAALRVELLEQSWSRFRPESELSRLNERCGKEPVAVSADLLRLVDGMKQAWLMTDGLFDPTVLAAVQAAGYDADFAEVAARPASAWLDIALRAVPGMAGVVVNREASTVRLPAGVRLDPGAIGKGLAADVVAGELRSAGAAGVLVNLGGDLAISGTTEQAWAIDVEDERRDPDDPRRILQTIRFPSGTDQVGVATSTVLKRRWAQGRRHHVIDPRTGLPSTGRIVQVTVVASSASRAEVLATASLLLPAELAPAWLAEHGGEGIVLTADNTHLEHAEARHG